MTFPLTPAVPFVDSTGTVPAAVLNAWATAISQALDGTGGSGGVAYTPLTRLIVHGSGMDIDSLKAWVRTGDFINVDTGATLEVKSGGTFQTDSGATATFGSDVTFIGTHSRVEGGTWENWVDVYQILASTFHIGDTTLGVGHLVIDGRSAGAGSDVTFKGNAVAHWLTGTFLTMDSSTTGAFGGTNTMSGTWLQTGAYTQQGALTKSGTGAYTSERESLFLALPATVDGTQVDYIQPTVAGGGAGALTLSAPPHVSGIFLKVSCPLGLAAGSVTIVDAASSTTIANLGTGAGGGATFQNVAGFAICKTQNVSGTWRWVCVFAVAGN